MQIKRYASTRPCRPADHSLSLSCSTHPLTHSPQWVKRWDARVFGRKEARPLPFRSLHIFSPTHLPTHSPLTPYCDSNCVRFWVNSRLACRKTVRVRACGDDDLVCDEMMLCVLGVGGRTASSASTLAEEEESFVASQSSTLLVLPSSNDAASVSWAC